MPRTTDDYIEYIEDQLGFNPETIRANIRAGFWNYEYYEMIRTIGEFAEEEGVEVIDPEALAALEALRIQLGSGLSDRRKYILEAENEFVYVPSSPCCFVKCLTYCETKLGGTRSYEDFMQLLRTNKHIKHTGEVSLQVVAKVLRYCFSEILVLSPVGLVTWRKAERRWQLRQGNPELTRYRIGFVNFKEANITDDMPNRGHYVVFKTRSHPSIENIPIEVRIQQVISLDNQRSYTDFSPKQRLRNVVIWDLEAYRCDEPPTQGKFIEYAIGAMILNLEDLKPDETVINRIDACRASYKMFKGEYCFALFLTWLSQLEIAPLQCFAHNSGMFDTLLLRQQNNPLIKFIDKIENNCKRIILQRIRYLKKNIVFKDTCAFLSLSLKMLCKPFMFDTHYKKASIDHSIITKVNYDEMEPVWAPYLELDVLSLAEITLKFELNLWHVFGESVTCNLTVSSIANSFMKKACYLKEVYIIDDMMAQSMIQLSCYGGRIFHTITRPIEAAIKTAVIKLYKTHYPEMLERGVFNITTSQVVMPEDMAQEHGMTWLEYYETLPVEPIPKTNGSIKYRPVLMPVKQFIEERINNVISFDANQLYPAAMAEGSFPIGRATMHQNFSVLKQELIEGSFTGRAICDVTLISPPIAMPIVPVKTEKFGNYFPVGQFRQVMNDVDIQEAIRFGYTLQEIHSVIHWARHCKLFDDIMPYMFNERNRARKEKNAALAQTMKTMACSMYGVNLKRPIETEYGYKAISKTLKKAKKLPNGQMEFEYHMTPKLTCAPQIGSFVLAYSRVIMNRLLEKLHAHEIPNIVYYGDTDSVYISEALLPIVGFTTDLGGFKNDYGDGKCIVDFRFLGSKRYSLRFNEEFRTPEAIKRWTRCVEQPDTETQEDKAFMAVYSDKLAYLTGLQERGAPYTNKERRFMDPDIYKHKMCGIRFLNQRKRNVTDNLPLGQVMVDQLPNDQDFFAQLDEYLAGTRDTIQWFQDVWRRTDRGVFIFNRQLKQLRKAEPRRFFYEDGTSTPLFSNETQKATGRCHLEKRELIEVPVQPIRNYAATAFKYAPERMGLRFPPNKLEFAGPDPKALVSSDPRLATSFVVSGIKPTKKLELVDCSEVKMVFKRYFKGEDNKTYEYYDVTDMTFAGPKHKETPEVLDRDQLLEQYAYVLLSNMPFLSNQLKKDDEGSKRFLDMILTSIKNPSALFKVAEPKTVTHKLAPSKLKPKKKTAKVTQ